MTRNKLKAIEKAVQHKTGKGLEFPTVLYQDTDGKFYDFNTVGKQNVEPVRLDPKIRHEGGNHYLFSGVEGIDNREILEWIQTHPELMFDYHD